LRDAFFVVRALNSLSELGTMEDYLRWLTNVVVRSAGGHVQPLYGIGLEEALPEQILDHLPGYLNYGPVRVGNQAYEHFQHDVYGNIVLGAAQAFHDNRLLHRAGIEHFQHLEAVGERAFSVYDQPDAGMWELRTRLADPYLLSPDEAGLPAIVWPRLRCGWHCRSAPLTGANAPP